MYCFFASIFFFCRSGYILWCPLFFNSRRSVEDIIFRAKSSFLQVWIRLSVAPSTSVVLIRCLDLPLFLSFFLYDLIFTPLP
ncbi:hypothetical protein SORBI_3006G032500 [Sorghum bicolor]|uniref:Uncharacterized protein n=1 Tax=Sorghum bicolor TaxID=4558 RepID=A0A1B6PJS4_SORBI|nr:hypothetical protein SORBI_3006G032500 [Sorghum bicolor]KXG25924.1 hypothetical protein SORBI_3006G032500 [Sorghum bicolor]OQU81245.1 hypothetical protein SORBI_3006G032500 [Sorghum bicolor]OQU81247.1 hypothetical protein SORBI_3006G032500 [Sorghum bicolor]